MLLDLSPRATRTADGLASLAQGRFRGPPAPSLLPPASLWPHLSPADTGAAARPGGRLLGGREARLEALLPDLGRFKLRLHPAEVGQAPLVPSHLRALLGGQRDQDRFRR